jgi:hypothetical protein
VLIFSEGLGVWWLPVLVLTLLCGGIPLGSAWMLAQTNYDHWLVDPPTDPRRTVAEKTMESLGQAIVATHSGLYAVASTYPVHNPDTACVTEHSHHTTVP